MEVTPEMFANENVQKLLSIPWSSYTGQNVIGGGVQKKQNEKQRFVVVYVPIGIPGMGKSTMLSAFERVVKDNKDTLVIISSDDIRKNCMDKLKK